MEHSGYAIEVRTLREREGEGRADKRLVQNIILVSFR